jgi:hypothetical protein
MYASQVTGVDSSLWRHIVPGFSITNHITIPPPNKNDAQNPQPKEPKKKKKKKKKKPS